MKQRKFQASETCSTRKIVHKMGFILFFYIQGVLEIRGMLGEWKNREFRNREFQGMAVKQVFEPLYSFKVSIWGLCNNCN